MIDAQTMKTWPEALSLTGSEWDSRLADSAFETLVANHYRRIYNLVYRMIGTDVDAADLTQDVFVRAYRALPRLRAEAAQGVWLRRIATNVCLDYLRRRNNSPSVSSLDARVSEDSDTLQSWDIADPTCEPDRIYAHRERHRVIQQAIASLPADYRAVIVLHHIEQLRVEEIAEAMDVPTGTIKSRLSRARRELRRKLSPYFDPELFGLPE